MTHKNIRDKSISFIMIHILFILAFPISGARHVVNSTLKDNSLEGSFPFFLSNASDGDTIVFNIPDSSTIQVNGMLRITADLMIDGRNEATGDRIVLKSASLFIGGCQTRISNFIFREFTGTSTERYCAIRDSGATTVVWLDSVEIEGRFFYDNDVFVRPAIQNYQGAVTNLSNCKISKWPGGGVKNSMGRLNITNSVISDNSCYSDEEIGGIYNYNGVVTVFNTTISNNSINIPGYNGGWTGGAGISNFDGIMTVFNCTIKENTASNHLLPGVSIILQHKAGEEVL